jgi:hypothetical protein
VPEPHPTKQQIARFLKAFEAAMQFDAQQQLVRGQTAFDPSEWPDKPDEAILVVRRWLTELAT